MCTNDLSHKVVFPYAVLARHATHSVNVLVCHGFFDISFYPFWYKMSLLRLTYFVINVSSHLGVVLKSLSTM